jgi:hypothetical protein
MPVPGAAYGSLWGPGAIAFAHAAGGVVTFDAKAAGATWAARFTATQALPVISVKINFSAVTMGTWAGTVTVEAIDATTGKPPATVTPYDVNATKAAITFTTGWNTITFAVAPTTNLTPGVEYAIVLRTTTAATALTINSHIAQSAYGNIPNCVLTSADSGTSWAEVSPSFPIGSLLLTGGGEDPMGMLPYATRTTNNLINDDATALKFVVPSNMTMVVAAVEFIVTKTGTPPAGSDIRIRIFDSGDNVVANSTITLDLDSLSTNATLKKIHAKFPNGLITLAAGTYRVVFDCASSTSTSNCWRMFGAIPNVAGNAPAHFNCSTAPAIATPVWTDTTDQLPINLVLDSLSAVVGASAGGVIGG